VCWRSCLLYISSTRFLDSNYDHNESPIAHRELAQQLAGRIRPGAAIPEFEDNAVLLTASSFRTPLEETQVLFCMFVAIILIDLSPVIGPSPPLSVMYVLGISLFYRTTEGNPFPKRFTKSLKNGRSQELLHPYVFTGNCGSPTPLTSQTAVNSLLWYTSRWAVFRRSAHGQNTQYEKLVTTHNFSQKGSSNPGTTAHSVANRVTNYTI